MSTQEGLDIDLDDYPEEVELQSQPEPQPQPDMRRMVSRGMLKWVFAATAFGGLVGAGAGYQFEQAHSAEKQAKMAEYERCQEVVAGNAEPGSATAIVRLASLSEQQIRDCQLKQVAPAVSKALESSDLFGLDSELIAADFNPQIQLPSIGALEAAHANVVHKASTDTRLEIPIGMAAGISAGFVIGGLIAVAGTRIGDRIEEHRQPAEYEATI